MYTARLYSAYGPLLSERQRKFIDLHCNEDLSLSEIAEGEGISRQAVFDAIKQGRKRLDRFESVLHLGEKIAGGKAQGESDLDVARVGQIFGEIETMARSGVIHDGARVRDLIGEIRGMLGLAKAS
jgi:predicted DNA-binding protein YlxM (UPF0122 family)